MTVTEENDSLKPQLKGGVRSVQEGSNGKRGVTMSKREYMPPIFYFEGEAKEHGHSE